MLEDEAHLAKFNQETISWLLSNHRTAESAAGGLRQLNNDNDEVDDDDVTFEDVIKAHSEKKRVKVAKKIVLPSASVPEKGTEIVVGTPSGMVMISHIYIELLIPCQPWLANSASWKGRVQ